MNEPRCGRGAVQQVKRVRWQAGSGCACPRRRRSKQRTRRGFGSSPRSMRACDPGVGSIGRRCGPPCDAARAHTILGEAEPAAACTQIRACISILGRHTTYVPVVVMSCRRRRHPQAKKKQAVLGVIGVWVCVCVCGFCGNQNPQPKTHQHVAFQSKARTSQLFWNVYFVVAFIYRASYTPNKYKVSPRNTKTQPRPRPDRCVVLECVCLH